MKLRTLLILVVIPLGATAAQAQESTQTAVPPDSAAGAGAEPDLSAEIDDADAEDGSLPEQAVHALGQLDEAVQIHGYGSWSAGYSDNANTYRGLSARKGDWDNVTAAVAILARPLEQLFIDTQFEFEVEDEEAEVELDYVVARWAFTDELAIQFGQAKQPFGLYSEVFDVGTLRPFVSLPFSVYGPTGLIAEAYRGVAVTGNLALGDAGWSVSYDLYFGHIDIPEERPYAEPGRDELFELEGVANATGGKVTVHTPIDGLLFGAAGYTGESEVEAGEEEEEEGEEEEGFDRRTGVGVHIEYQGHGILFRTEIARLMEVETVNAFYAEAGYHLTDSVQVVARFEWLDTEFDDFEGDETVLRHQEVAAGLNYWFSHGLVIKASYHHVTGNRHVFPAQEPDALAERIAEGRFAETTHVLLVGTAFSF